LLIEQVPKLLHINQLGIFPNLKLLINDDLPNQFKQILEYYGVTNELIEVPREATLNVENLVYVRGVAHSPVDISPEVHPCNSDHFISPLVRELLSVKNEITETGVDNIYISRPSGSGGRNELNEDDVRALAVRLGFTVVHPETMSYKEQVACFANAKVILGYAGAAFTNIIHCRPAITVIIISLFEGNNVDYSVWLKLLPDADIRYFLTPNVAGDHIYKNFCSCSVDTNQLETFIHQIFTENLC
jgi:capsular polysaccharide biosynthesis protein